MTAREIFQKKKKEYNLTSAFSDWFRTRCEQMDIEPDAYKKILAHAPGRGPTTCDFILNETAQKKLLSYKKGMVVKGSKSNKGKSFAFGCRKNVKEKRKPDCRHYDDCLNRIAFQDIRKMGCEECKEYKPIERHAVINCKSINTEMSYRLMLRRN